jgi:magnesium-transporting ATPase (P-type)
MSSTESRSAEGSLQEKSGQSNKPLSRPPHALEFEVVLKELSVDPCSGLLEDEASRRLIEYGPNELQQKKGVQPVKIFLEQIFNAMTLVSFIDLPASYFCARDGCTSRRPKMSLMGWETTPGPRAGSGG